MRVWMIYANHFFSMSLIDNIAKLVTLNAEVIYKEKLSDNIYHLKIKGEDLHSVDYIPGYHLRIMVGLGKETKFRDKIRTYSVWNYDKSTGTIDLAVCAHSDGVGAQWIREVSVGDQIYFSKPKGKFILDTSGDYFLFIGDLSALAHLYEIRRHLSAEIPVKSFIYSDNPQEFFSDLAPAVQFDNYKLLYPDINPIKDTIRQFVTNNQGKGIVYIGGDGRVCADLTRYFRSELNWKNNQIKTKPFWHPDKKGLE